ncbi:MAG: hypothetical protein KGZ58_09770 [Ignavibacteriales bacterium]|nr:hypothetical protein [Ignavibacteriales bacterium]
MPYQNISATLDAPNIVDVLKRIDEARAMLPFLINLTPEERETIPKMGDKTVAFVEKTIDYGNGNPQIVPPYTDLTELARDTNLNKSLAPIENALAQLHEAISDTRLAVGSEAYTASLSIYHSVRNAAKSNVPGTDTIYQDLKQRFPGRKKPPADPT